MVRSLNKPYKFGHRRWRRLLMFMLASVSACGSGQAPDTQASRTRTIKVVNTRNDNPIPDVNVEIKAIGRAFGEYGPTYDKQVWDLTTDRRGEVHVQQPAGSTLYVDVQTKPGYTISMSTIKYYEKQRKYVGPDRAGGNWEDTYYLTPSADFDYEYVRHAYRTAADVMDGKVRITREPVSYLINNYSLAKSHAEAEREKAALLEFCRFAESLKGEAANAWPTLKTDYLRSQGQMFMDDCAAGEGATTRESSLR